MLLSGYLSSAPTAGHGIIMQVQGTGTLRYLHRFPFGGGGGSNYYTTDTYADGLWHHATAVKSADRMTLYMDGILEGSIADVTKFNQPLRVVLGRLDHTRAERYFTGAMDDVRIYDRILTPGEVAWLASKTVPFTQPLEVFLTPQNPDINAYNDKIIDLKDYTVLADMWLEELLWPQ